MVGWKCSKPSLAWARHDQFQLDKDLQDELAHAVMSSGSQTCRIHWMVNLPLSIPFWESESSEKRGHSWVITSSLGFMSVTTHLRRLHLAAALWGADSSLCCLVTFLCWRPWLVSPTHIRTFFELVYWYTQILHVWNIYHYLPTFGPFLGFLCR